MQTVLNVIVYVFSGMFIVLAIGLLFAYYRMRHPGTVLMAVVYVAAAGAALGYMHWWPLLAGLALTWVIRLMGLEPRVDREP